jgi:hypothetical protein
MEIIIEPVIDEQHRIAMRRIRQQVFERELGLAFTQLDETDRPGSFHLLARVSRYSEPAAVLSVVDTSDDYQLHERYGLSFERGARVARYTQLAVLKPYRGMNLPLRMIFEAHCQFVSPSRFDYTWLLFNAERAASSLLCRHLAFIPGRSAFQSEFGCTRTLVRDEHAACSEQAIRQTAQCLKPYSLLLEAGNLLPVHLSQSFEL